MSALIIASSLLVPAGTTWQTRPNWELAKDAHPVLMEALTSPKVELPKLEQILNLTEKGVTAWDGDGRPDPDYASYVKVVLRSGEPLTLPFIAGEKSFIMLFSTSRYGSSVMADGARWSATLIEPGGMGLSNLASRLTPRSGDRSYSAILTSQASPKFSASLRIGLTRSVRFPGLLSVGDKAGSGLMGVEVVEVRNPTPEEVTAYGVEWVRKPVEARTTIVLKPTDRRTNTYLSVSASGPANASKHAQVDSNGALTYVERTSANEQSLWRNSPTFVQSWIDNTAAKSGEVRFKYVTNLAASELKNLSCDVTANGVMNLVGFKPPKQL